LNRLILVCALLLSTCALSVPKTLQQRVNETPAGGTLKLAGVQTITAPLVINKSITLDFTGLTIDATKSDGAIVIETLTYGVPVTGVTIQGATIKGGAGHVVWVGAVKDFTLRDSIVTGGTKEAIYHQDTYGKVSKNIRIENNTIYGHAMGAIDSNDPGLDGMVITGNVIRDGEAGIHFVGHNATISDNQFINLSGIALTLNVEQWRDSYVQNVIIANNLFQGIHSVGAATYAINSMTSSFGDGGILITGNVITDMQGVDGQPCYAIHVSGRALVSNNLIRGATGTTTVGIAVDDDPFTQTNVIVSHNVIEQAEHNYDYGVFFSVNAFGIAEGNIVQAANLAPLVTYTDGVIVK
jgi:hypothetical protein